MGVGGMADSEMRFEVYVDELDIERARAVLTHDAQEDPVDPNGT